MEAYPLRTQSLGHDISDLDIFKALPENVQAAVKSKAIHEEIGQTSISNAKTLLYRQGNPISKNPRFYIILNGQVILYSSANQLAQLSPKATVQSRDQSFAERHGINDSESSQRGGVSTDQRLRRTLKATALTIALLNDARRQAGRQFPESFKIPTQETNASARAANRTKTRSYEEISENSVFKLGDALVALKPGDCFGEEILSGHAAERHYSAVLNGHGIFLALEDAGVLHELRKFLLQKFSPTFVLRPEWCREALRSNSAGRTPSERIRIAHILDSLGFIDCSKHAESLDYVIDSVRYMTLEADEILAQEEQKIIDIHILMSGKINFYKLNCPRTAKCITSEELQQLGGYVGTAETSGDILMLPAPWFHGRYDCSMMSSTSAEVIYFSLDVFHILVSFGALRCNCPSIAPMLSKDNRSAYENARLAAFAFFSGMLTEFPVNCHIDLASRFQSRSLNVGELTSNFTESKHRSLVVSGIFMQTQQTGQRFIKNPSYKNLRLKMPQEEMIWLQWFSQQSTVLNLLHELESEDDGNTLRLAVNPKAIETYFSCFEQELLGEQHTVPTITLMSHGSVLNHCRTLENNNVNPPPFSAMTPSVICYADNEELKDMPAVSGGKMGISYFERIRRAAHIQPMERHQEDIEVLRAAIADPIFASLPASAVRQICRDLELLTMKRDEIICSEDHVACGLYYVIKGSLAACKLVQGVTLSIYKPGATFGHACLFPDKKYRYSVVARETSEILVLPQDKIEKYFALLETENYVDIMKCRITTSMPFDLRTDEDQMQLERAVMSLPLIKTKHTKIVSEICRNARYRIVEPGELICVEGETVQAIHLLLSGSVLQYAGLHGIVRKKLRLTSGIIYDHDQCKQEIQKYGPGTYQGKLLRVRSGPYSEEWSAARVYHIDESGNFSMVNIGDSATFQIMGNLRQELSASDYRNTETDMHLAIAGAMGDQKTSRKITTPPSLSHPNSNTRRGLNFISTAHVSTFAANARKLRKRHHEKPPFARSNSGLHIHELDLNDVREFSMAFSSGKLWDVSAPTHEEFVKWINCIVFHIMQACPEPLGRFQGEVVIGSEILVIPANSSIQSHPTKAKQSAFPHTMLAKSRCELIVLYHHDIDNAEREFSESIRQEALKILRSMDLNMFSLEILKQIAANVKFRILQKGDALFHAGEKCTDLIFLAEGECAIKMRGAILTCPLGINTSDLKGKHESLHMCTVRNPAMIVLHTSTPLELSSKTDHVLHTVTAIASSSTVRVFALKLEDLRRIEEEHRLPLLERLMAKLEPIKQAQRAQLAQASECISQALACCKLLGSVEKQTRAKVPTLDPNLVFFGKTRLGSLTGKGDDEAGVTERPATAPESLFLRSRSLNGSPHFSRRKHWGIYKRKDSPQASLLNTSDIDSQGLAWSEPGSNRAPSPLSSDAVLPVRTRSGFVADADISSIFGMPGFHRLHRPRNILYSTPRKLVKQSPLRGVCALHR